MGTEHRLEIPGEMEQIAHACQWVVQVAEEVGLDMRDVNHLELAIDEAVTNIVEHSYGDDGANKSIDIVIDADGHTFKVTVIDEGPPFNPLQIDLPNPADNLDARPEQGGGWGVFFIQKLMDKVEYEFAANKNHLIMVKHIG
jgi:anti-sigma regulatory factor (Ser/Thr protein kinase)